MRPISLRTRLAWAFSLVAIAPTLLTILGLNAGLSWTLHGSNHMRYMMGTAMEVEMQRVTGQLVLRWSLFSAVGAIVIAMAGSNPVSRRITRPLSRLVSAASKMDLGTLDRRVPEEGESEIVELAKAFNGMADRLEKESDVRRQLLADVTHELRHPISILQGRLEMMLDGVSEPTPERLAALQNEVMRMNRLVQDLRDISLAEVGALSLDVRDVDIGDLVRTLAEDLGPAAAEQEIELKADVASHTPTVKGDEDRLRQVIFNLVSNALRFTPTGGRVRIRVESVARPSAGVSIDVSDTGLGIDPDRAAHVFDRFYRADAARSRSVGGSGLGLAIAKSFAELHGGSIGVESTPGLGTTFTVYLPLQGRPRPEGRAADER